MIDVSQSVEHDVCLCLSNIQHPNALEFLRKDLSNVRSFFTRLGVVVPSVRELFYFTVCDLDKIVASDATLEKRDITDARSCLQTHASNQSLNDILDVYTDKFIANAVSQEENEDDDGKVAREMDDHVFANTYIPRTLEDVTFIERKLFGGENVMGEDMVYKNVSGIQDMNIEDDEESSDSSEEDEEDDVYVNSDEFDECAKTLKKDEDKDEKKVC
jgi:RIO kinase 1